jgi:hypothetical protein
MQRVERNRALLLIGAIAVIVVGVILNSMVLALIGAGGVALWNFAVKDL